MSISLFLRGLLLGLSIAAPVGPIGVLCIRRTLVEGRALGLVSGLGAATADAVYGCVAGFGLTFISDALVGRQTWIRLIGGLFLCYLGIRALLTKPAEQPASASDKGLVGAYASTLLLTLTNPMTILSFAAVFASLGITETGGDYGAAGILVMGVFSGSALWWFALSSGVSLLRERFTPRALRWVNVLSGLIILVFGLFALLSL